MVAKKRTNLRARIQAKAASSSSAGPTSSSSQPSSLPQDPLAFLHEPKQTKRDKLLSKRESFLTKLQSDGSNTISKSSLRRRKRKAKEELLPKMQDLLTVLDKTTNDDIQQTAQEPVATQNINIVPTQKFINKNPKNTPNPNKKSGIKVIENQERARFGLVLKDEKFKKTPFAALRESISQRLQDS